MRAVVLLLGFVACSQAFTTKTCKTAAFYAKTGWPSQKIFKTIYTPSPQACAASCMDHPFCDVVGYDFPTMKCAHSYGKDVTCSGQVFTAVTSEMINMLSLGTKNTQLTMGCLKCLDNTTEGNPSWAQTWLPPTPLPADQSVFSADDKAFIAKTFATPECVVSKMVAQPFSSAQFKGRWWGLLTAGPKQGNIGAFLLDMSLQEDNATLLDREISLRAGKFCNEDFYTWQPVTFGSQNIWQKSINQTSDYDVLKWNSQGQTASFYFRTLWNNTNVLVQFVCYAAFANGTCDPSQTGIYVYSRTQAKVLAGDLDTFNIFLNYTCTPTAYVQMDPTNACVADYVNRNTSIYYVRTGCDYTNNSWIDAHTTQAPYDTLAANPNWAGVNGEWFGQVTVLEFQPQYTPEGKLFVPMYRQNQSAANTCQVINTTAWTINDTSVYPGWFPTKNIWVQTANVTFGANNTANTIFWRIAHDGVLASTISCVGAVPCQNSSVAFSGGSRRYRKLSVLWFRTRLYPVISRACIDPTQIPNCRGIRQQTSPVPEMTCGADRDAKSCLNSDLKNFAWGSMDMSKFAGTWVLALVNNIQQTQALACNFAANGTTGFSLTCYFKVLGTCISPYNIILTQSTPPGNFTWTFNDPMLGTYSEQLIILYQTDNVLAFYGCAFNGADSDGSCRDERMIAFVFVKPGYTLTLPDTNKLQTLYDAVCLWTPAQLFPSSTNDACFAPLNIGSG